MAVIFLFDGNSNGALVPKERSQNRIRALGWDRMSSRSGRRLQTIPQSCYENMLVNGDFESGTANWSIAGIVDTFTTNLRQDGAGGSHALFQDRYVVTNGIQQGLATPEALPCFDGEGFYFRITADLRLYDPTTGEGISACRNDRQHNYMTHCPRMKLWVRKANGDSHTFEVHDANMVWNANGWNQFDVIFQVPEHFNGMDNINCIFTWFGAQPDVAYLVDNVVLRRVEHADLPDGHHIWTQDPLDCNDNIFVNDDGEYQSPYGWQAFGHWSSDYTLTVVEDGSGSGPAGTGFALVALDRLNPYNTGPGQWFNAKSSNMPCFDGFGYYFRIEGDVRLYDQSTGVGVTTCSPQDETTIRNCPRLHLTVQREGEKHASSAFYDEDITTSWNPTGWNHIDMIVAMQPLEHDPPIQYVRINYLGGPPNSVLMLDRARARRISYEEIPAGHPVFSLTQAAPLMESPIKTCKSSGDPHYSTFGGTKFDYHELGWHILYEKGGLRVEAHHAELPGGSIATLNDSVRVTYQGTEYIFSGGNQPLADEYYDPESRMLTFPSPEVKVSVSSRYFFQGSWINNVFVTTSEIAGAVGLCVDENSETDAIIQAGSPPIVYDPNGITEEEAQAECSALNGTAAFNDCVMDYRLAANAVASSTDSTEGSPSLVARSFVTSSVEVETIEEELQEIAAQEVAAEFAVVEAAVNGDPTILGLKGQAFKFEGKSDAWYANLSTKSVQWNLKFHQFPSCPAHEDMMISGLGLYIEPPAAAGDEGYSEEGHSIQIKVNEDKFTPGCPKTGGTCLGEGSLEIIVDGDSITQPGEYVYGRNETAVRVIAYNTFASCSRRWFDFNEQASSNTDHLGDRKRILFRGKKPAEILFDSASKLLDADGKCVETFAWMLSCLIMYVLPKQVVAIWPVPLKIVRSLILLI